MASHTLTLRDIDVRNKRVLMRVDFNVPQDKSGSITDDTRIQASLPSILNILDRGGICILMSHLGRPKAQVDLKYTLKPCADRLAALLGKPCAFVNDCIGPDVEAKVKSLLSGEVLLLENLRFYPAEEEPEVDPNFARQLASLGDIYVNDAFGTAHRAHSSTATIAQYFPQKACAGFLLEREIRFLTGALRSPQRPFVGIIGGAKVSTKLGVISALKDIVDCLLIGGGMAYTFALAQGYSIGDSLAEPDCVADAKMTLEAFQKAKVPLILPIDFICADRFANDAKQMLCILKDGIPKGWQGLDIGPKTLELFSQKLSGAKTVLWNGPLGVFEMDSFARGTFEITKLIAGLNTCSIIGGGDSVAAVNKAGLAERMTHLSTGGGACLELIEFGHLPGLDVLTQVSQDKIIR